MRFVKSALMLLLCVAAPMARAMTVDELIAKNIEARGGLDHLRAITSIRSTGIARIGGGDRNIQRVYVLLQARPALLRREGSMQGQTSITAFDGTAGWSLNPFRGRKEPQLLPPDAVRELAFEADIDGPLVDFRKKGYTVEYAGTEDVDGTEAHKLHVTLKEGDVLDVFLDPDYFLEIREISRRTVRGVEEESETDPGNYGRVNGVMFPFSIETGARGGEKTLRIALTKIEVNVPMDAALFKFPAPAPVPANGGRR